MRAAVAGSARAWPTLKPGMAWNLVRLWSSTVRGRASSSGARELPGA